MSSISSTRRSSQIYPRTTISSDPTVFRSLLNKRATCNRSIPLSGSLAIARVFHTIEDRRRCCGSRCQKVNGELARASCSRPSIGVTTNGLQRRMSRRSAIGRADFPSFRACRLLDARKLDNYSTNAKSFAVTELQDIDDRQISICAGRNSWIEAIAGESYRNRGYQMLVMCWYLQFDDIIANRETVFCQRCGNWYWSKV